MAQKKFDFTTFFLVLFATMLGGYLRISPVLNLTLPLNDGGLFYAMTRDLQDNHFLLPVVTSFNNANIPYAYPPLAFYLYGFVSSLTGWPLMDMFRTLPPLFSTLSIPAFYFLARAFLKDKVRSGIAANLFAVLPASYILLIMGGGVTRSLGFLFYLLTLHSAYHMYIQGRWKDVVFTILFGTLTSLSHPESALRAAAGALYIYLFFARNRRGAVHTFFVFVGVMLLTSPWWATVMSNHGLEPFIAASRTGGHQPAVILAFIYGLFKNMLTEDIFLGFIGSLAMVGVIIQCTRKDLFFPLWLLITLIVEPRNSAVYLAVVVAGLGSIGLIDGLFRILGSFTNAISFPDQIHNRLEMLLVGTMNKIIIIYLLIFSLISSNSIVRQLASTYTVSQDDFNAIEWVNTHVRMGEAFLFMNTPSIPEWFPVLTHATTVGLVQGQEWKNKDFQSLLSLGNNLDLCIEQNFECLKEWENQSGLSYQYIYFGHKQIQTSHGPKYVLWPLERAMLKSGLFEVVFSSSTRDILRNKISTD